MRILPGGGTLPVMARIESKSDALYIAWQLDDQKAGSAGVAQERLTGGQGQNLYRLQSWVIIDGVVRALLCPDAPLESIIGAIWSAGTKPLQSRWVAGQKACAEAAREIEMAPVLMGLAAGPGQWPFSSATAG
jgi:hypothetical protein